ncbi:MAG: cobalt chelatase [Desulfovibrio sp. S3730MH75]|nr:MAG: cobalt chelatase [Desulfovibrio sp. S3730MH75]
MKKGILLAAHGSSNSAANSALDYLLNKVAAEYPNIPIQKAYTSNHILKALSKQGKHSPSIKGTLKEMNDEGITHIVIQSLHVIPGSEFENITLIISDIDCEDYTFKKAITGQPLLTNIQEIDEVSDIILTALPERDPENDALILVAHGSRHSENGSNIYKNFKYALEAKDKNAYMGRLNSQDDIVKIAAKIEASGQKKAFLLPLLFGAGNHVQKDMAGDHEESWKNIVSSKGIEAIPVIRGIGEFDIFANRWMDNLRNAIKKLDG